MANSWSNFAIKDGGIAEPPTKMRFSVDKGNLPCSTYRINPIQIVGTPAVTVTSPQTDSNSVPGLAEELIDFLARK